MGNNQIFNTMRVNAVMRALQDQRDIPSDLVFLGRTPIVPAIDSEIMAYFTGRVLIADLLADDARAVTYSSGKFNFEQTKIPNIKIGINMTQEQLNEIGTIAQLNGDLLDPEGIFTRWEQNNIDAILLGIRQRMEALCVAMRFDNFSYDRLGIKASGATFGMPTDLKVAEATPWSTAGSATPVTTVLTLKEIGRVRYGIDFDRMTLPLAAFRLMIKTTEFQDFAKPFLNQGITLANFSTQNTQAMQNLAQNVFGMKVIEFYDSRYHYQNEDATIGSARFSPINKVLLESTMNDNNQTVMDFANAIVTESIIAKVANLQAVNFNGPTRGPVAYATGEHNPPQMTHWGVARGFPRKHFKAASAVIDIGAVTDSIATGEPTLT